MYRIYSGATILHHPNTDIVAIDAKISDELNTHGSLSLELSGTDVVPLDPVSVLDDDGLIWRGRVLSVESEFDSRKKVRCEGALAYLCDTIIQPFSFRGRPDDHNGVSGLFHKFIDLHNAQLDSNDPRRFTVGTITVTDPNNYIYRSSESAMTTWAAITDKLIKTLGGYVYLSGPSLNVINYVSDFTDTSGQEIRFGENLLNLAQKISGDGIVTAIHAYGAQYPDETSIPPREVEPGGEGTLAYNSWNGNRLHVYRENATAKAIWGYICGTNRWDDITVEANLKTAADKWLQDNIAEKFFETLECTAADLSLLDVSIDKLNVGKKVRVRCDHLDIDTMMVCTKKETDLVDVSKTQITIGNPAATLSGMVGG